MTEPLAIMLFAAGFGTRMGELTRDRPKPLIDVNGRALIDYTLDLANAVRPPRIVANLHYLPDMLARHLSPLGVELSLEQPDILDTGGGLKAALGLLGTDPVITMNADAIWSGPNPLDCLMAAWDPARMDALLVCVPLASAIGRIGSGDFDADTAGRLRRGKSLVYGGIQIIKTDDVAAVPKRIFSLNEIWDKFQDRGRLFGLRYPGKWCDVGHPEGIRLAEMLLSEPHV